MSHSPDNKPTDSPLHTCMTKAIIAEGDQLRTGPQWVTARRARLKLYDDHLKCGDWSVPYSDIQEATLTRFRSTILRIPGYVLTLHTASKTYHFGLNGNKYWQGELPFPVTRKQGKIKLSFFSIAVRAFLVVLAAYYWWWLLKR